MTINPLPLLTLLAVVGAGAVSVATRPVGHARLAGAPQSAALQNLAQQVRSAETAFAASMAKRDLNAFASHIADDAVFFGGLDVLRGKAAVVAGWKAFFDGPQAPFSWAPESVEVLASGTLAFSSGPVRDADGRQTATFNSVWRRDADGRWRVVFDKGCACPQGR